MEPVTMLELAIAGGVNIASILGAALWHERRITRIERDVKWLVRERELATQHHSPMEH